MKNNEIIILDDNLINIYKKFKKYKSFLHKKTKFIYEGKNREIKQIVEVLNIKSRMKRLEYIFDKSCEEIDNKFKGENICEFKCNQCITQRKNKSNEVNGCCSSCRFQSNNGCTTKNLTCKLFFCSEIKNKYDVIEFKDLKLLNLLTRRQRLILKFDLFSSREEVLMDLFIGFITIAAFRELYTLIKNSLFLIFKNKQVGKVKGFNVKNFTISATILMIFMFAILNPFMPLIMILVGALEDLIIRIYKKRLTSYRNA